MTTPSPKYEIEEWIFWNTKIYKKYQPRPQSNFKKIALAPHDFGENFHLI